MKRFYIPLMTVLMLMASVMPLRAEWDFSIVSNYYDKIEPKNKLADFDLKGPVKTAEKDGDLLTFRQDGQLSSFTTRESYEEFFYDEKGYMTAFFVMDNIRYFQSDLTKHVITTYPGIKGPMGWKKQTAPNEISSKNESDIRKPYWNIVQYVSYKYTPTHKLKEKTVFPLVSLESSKYCRFEYDRDNKDSLLEERVIENNELITRKVYTYHGNLVEKDSSFSRGKLSETSRYEYHDKGKLARKITTSTSLYLGGTDTFLYDINGRIVSDPNYTYKYNEQGKEIEKINRRNGRSVASRVYNQQGVLVEEKIPFGKRFYDDKGREKMQVLLTSDTIFFNYNTDGSYEMSLHSGGRLTSKNIYNKKSILVMSERVDSKGNSVITEKNIFDAKDRIVQNTQVRDGITTVTTYTYDSWDNVLTCSVKKGSNAAKVTTYKYSYYNQGNN